MKTLNKTLAKLMFLFLSCFMSLAVLGQEGGGGSGTDINVDINKGGDGGGNWYAQPWVWIVGAAVFILLLVALLRGNSSRD